MNLRFLLFLTSLFPFSSSIMYRRYSNFSVIVLFSNIVSFHTAAQSPGHPFLILSGHGRFFQCFFCCCLTFRVLVFVSSALNGIGISSSLTIHFSIVFQRISALDTFL